MSKPATLAAMPPRWRVVIGFFVAPFVAALAFGITFPLYAGLPNIFDRTFRTIAVYLIFGAYPTALIIGVPTFFAHKDRFKRSVLNCMLAGALVASLPWLIIGVLATNDYSIDDGHVTAIDGVKTIWGWIDLAIGVGQIAIAGLFAGLVFWFVVIFRPVPPRSNSA
jgi:hypothetical protein